jgi:hypothetical protein
MFAWIVMLTPANHCHLLDRVARGKYFHAHSLQPIKASELKDDSDDDAEDWLQERSNQVRQTFTFWFFANSFDSIFL